MMGRVGDAGRGSIFSPLNRVVALRPLQARLGCFKTTLLQAVARARGHLQPGMYSPLSGSTGRGFQQRPRVVGAAGAPHPCPAPWPRHRGLGTAEAQGWRVRGGGEAVVQGPGGLVTQESEGLPAAVQLLGSCSLNRDGSPVARSGATLGGLHLASQVCRARVVMLGPRHAGLKGSKPQGLHTQARGSL